jgi:membrane protein required for colicin V production
MPLPVNGFDILLVAFLTMFVTIGAWRGFVREFMALLTWVIGGFAAWWGADLVAAELDGLTAEPVLRRVIGFAIVFVSVFVIGTVTAHLVHRFVLAQKAFRLPNTVLGGVVGAGRGVIIIVILFLLAGLTSLPQRGWWRDSALTPHFERLARLAGDYIPADVARHIRYG